MLTQLCVYNYTLVEDIQLEVQPGLTTLTGETGAGKSLLLDALGLVLGNKPRASSSQTEDNPIEVSALFDLTQHPGIRGWLDGQALPSGNECQLRRLITGQGRSRCFINGRSVALADLQNLGEQLVSIQGQHEHQALLTASTQRRLLDTYANANAVATDVEAAFQQLKQAEQALQDAFNRRDTEAAEYQLLRYQLDELEQAALEPDEVEHWESRQREASHAEQNFVLASQMQTHLTDDAEAMLPRLYGLLQSLNQLKPASALTENLHHLFKDAEVQLQEASLALRDYLDSLDRDPASLAEAEARLSTLYNLARKHRCKPEDLYGHYQSLTAQLESLTQLAQDLESLQNAKDETQVQYRRLAAKLSQSRQAAAPLLAAQVNEQLARLAMPSACFCIELCPVDEPSATGLETTRFLISTVPGKPALPLGKTASGGELSRIGLAIAVVTAKHLTTPTLIFDEVDAGIGGNTGDVVGHLLQQLGAHSQVLCVTHLAQVASRGHHHWLITKTLDATRAQSQIRVLDSEARIHEIARMLGGQHSTHSYALAEDMLERAEG